MTFESNGNFGKKEELFKKGRFTAINFKEVATANANNCWLLNEC